MEGLVKSCNQAMEENNLNETNQELPFCFIRVSRKSLFKQPVDVKCNIFRYSIENHWNFFPPPSFRPLPYPCTGCIVKTMAPQLQLASSTSITCSSFHLLARIWGLDILPVYRMFFRSLALKRKASLLQLVQLQNRLVVLCAEGSAMESSFSIISCCTGILSGYETLLFRGDNPRGVHSLWV